MPLIFQWTGQYVGVFFTRVLQLHMNLHEKAHGAALDRFWHLCGNEIICLLTRNQGKGQ